MVNGDPRVGPVRYVSRPVVIDAMCFDGSNAAAIAAWIGAAFLGTDEARENEPRTGRSLLNFMVLVSRDNRVATIGVGDWVVAESDGVGFYPCVAAAFTTRWREANPGSGHVANLDPPPKAEPDPTR
jgi:hypothetical protein